VVGDQQRAALVGDVLEPARLDPEPLRVQELEQPLPARGRAGIAAEIVDDVAAAPHRERAPPPPHGLERQPAAQIDRKHRRALLLDAALELAHLGAPSWGRARGRRCGGDAGLLARCVVAEEREVASGHRRVGHAGRRAAP
jgi:hypothetical protein